jgi:hypothetical protein
MALTYSVLVDGETAGRGMDYPTAYEHARGMATNSPYMPRPIRTDDEATYPLLLTKGFESKCIYSGRINPCAGHIEIKPEVE